jgi:hypothetical protein
MKMKRKIKTLSALISVFIFSIIGFLGEQSIAYKSHADASLSVLPISKGGTGNNLSILPTANKFKTPRSISGISFDGTADINLGNTGHRIEIVVADSPAYIKFYNRNADNLSHLEIASAVCPFFAFSGEIMQKPNSAPIQKIITVDPSVVNTRNDAFEAISSNCLSYTWSATGEFYLRIANTSSTRPVFWTDVMPETLGMKVTDAQEKASLAAKTWYKFDFVKGDINATPVPQPSQ